MTGATTCVNAQRPSATPQGPSVTHTGRAGEAGGDVVGTATTAAIVFEVPSSGTDLCGSPRNVMQCLVHGFPGGNSSGAFYLAFPIIIALAPQVREPTCDSVSKRAPLFPLWMLDLAREARDVFRDPLGPL